MFDSVRTRLTLWYVGILALVIVGFALLTYLWTIRVLNQDTDARLEEMARNFAVALEAEQTDEEESRRPVEVIFETINEFRFRDYEFVIYEPDGQPVASTADFEIPPNGETVNSPFRDEKIGNETFRSFRTSVAVGQNSYQLLVLHSLREQITFKWRLTGIFLIAVPLALLLAGLGGYFLARKSLAPIVLMSEQARRIGAANLNERLLIKNERDELGQLTTVFNDLLARLDASFERQRRFMADASHELRTPLAIVRGESEVALSNDRRTSADYRESLEIVHDESKRLTKIVEDLFTLARADAGQFNRDLMPVYLDEIVADCVRSVRVLAKKEISLTFSATAELPMSGDESLLHRLFLNLLDNAVKYNRIGGTVSVDCQQNAENYEVRIADSGQGIPPAEQMHIFERFYRVDKARSRAEETQTSGAGLGLSIAQWIAEIHQGNIKLLNSDEKGSIFAVIFPKINGKPR